MSEVRIVKQVTFNFKGCRFVVTGATSGMGRTVAIELASAGALVLAIGRNEERLHSIRSQFPDNIFTEQLDVCDDSALESAIRDFVAEHGKFNGGVHAAGISEITPLKNYDEQVARQIMDVSFWAGMKLLSLITKAKYGETGSSIVLFSSVCAYSHEKGMFAYAAAKAAIDNGIRSAAKEIANKKHRVNSIVPGWVKTPMVQQAGELANAEAFFEKHLLGAGVAEDVCGMILFLLSDRTSWVTGSNIVVDGGYLA